MNRRSVIAIFLAAAVMGSTTPAAHALPTSRAGQTSAIQAPTKNAKEILVSNAWVRASEYSDKTGGMTGVFATITNKTKKTITLIGGVSSFSPMIQTHQVVDGMMTEKKGGIKIAAGKSVTLEPGGLHVMMMNLKKAILPGTLVDLKLNFTGAKPVTLKLIAKTAGAGDETYFSNKSATPSPAK